MVEDWVEDALHSHTFEGCEGLKAELDCFTNCVGELVRPFKAGSLSTGIRVRVPIGEKTRKRKYSVSRHIVGGLLVVSTIRDCRE